MTTEGSNKVFLTWRDVNERAELLSKKIWNWYGHSHIPIFPVPRGGVFPAMLIHCLNSIAEFPIVETPEEALAIVDDIVDSGATRKRFEKYDRPFFSLVDKSDPKETVEKNSWVVFPWEVFQKEDQGPTENITRLLQFIGEDVTREGLQETPQRVLRSYKELFAGYKQKPEDVLKVFEDDTCDEMVVVKNIEFFSTCEHHMLPFFGRANIAYIPNGRVIGVSKLPRILEVYARRLQIQERLTEQITTALDDHLKPKGSACVLEATHFCMTARGVQKQHSKMVTCSLTGVFRNQGPRQEFFQHIQFMR